MKICQECGHENPNDVDFCQECGRNFKANIVKAKNSPAIINSALYKVDKKTGNLRLSKTKAISLSSFTVIVLFFILMGQLFPASAMWIPIWYVPSSLYAKLIASSKSLASAGSMVNVSTSRMSRRRNISFSSIIFISRCKSNTFFWIMQLFLLKSKKNTKIFAYINFFITFAAQRCCNKQIQII